jgi:DNA-binding NtrC family response regulator
MELEDVLVVDDDGLVLQTIRLTLKKEYNLHTATSYDEAMKILNGKEYLTYKTLIFDVNLDEDLSLRRGIKLAEYAIEHGYKGNIILMTGNDMDVVKKDTMDLNAKLKITYIKKPFMINNLEFAVKGMYTD